MSANYPPGYFEFMEAFDNDELPDGAWWAVLEDGAREANQHFKIKRDPFDAVHAYLTRNSP